MIDVARPERGFPVVCVGGSAGGLDAYARLLKQLPPDMGVAIVIVNHVRTFSTMLHEILPRFTAMPIELITERLMIEPDLPAPRPAPTLHPVESLRTSDS